MLLFFCLIPINTDFGVQLFVDSFVVGSRRSRVGACSHRTFIIISMDFILAHSRYKRRRFE